MGICQSINAKKHKNLSSIKKEIINVINLYIEKNSEINGNFDYNKLSIIDDKYQSIFFKWKMNADIIIHINHMMQKISLQQVNDNIFFNLSFEILNIHKQLLMKCLNDFDENKFYNAKKQFETDFETILFQINIFKSLMI